MVDEGGERNFGRRSTDSLERIWDEVLRLRDRQHSLESDVAAMRYVAEQVHELAREVREASERYQQLSRRALERPTAAGYSALIAFAAFVVALAAFIFTATHHH
jgi:hypothetical protein